MILPCSLPPRDQDPPMEKNHGVKPKTLGQQVPVGSNEPVASSKSSARAEQLGAVVEVPFGLLTAGDENSAVLQDGARPGSASSDASPCFRSASRRGSQRTV